MEGHAEGEPIPTLVRPSPRPPTGRHRPASRSGPVPATPLDAPLPIRPRADELLRELRTGAPPPKLRPRWARRGWIARRGLDEAPPLRAGRPLKGEPRPFFLRGISALLRAPTDGPDLFLKAVFPPFHAEPVLTHLLADRYPRSVPTVIAIEPDEGWLIVEDIGSRGSDDLPADRAAGLGRGAAALVEIQRTLAAADLSECAGPARRPGR